MSSDTPTGGINDHFGLDKVLDKVTLDFIMLNRDKLEREAHLNVQTQANSLHGSDTGLPSYRSSNSVVDSGQPYRGKLNEAANLPI